MAHHIRDVLDGTYVILRARLHAGRNVLWRGGRARKVRALAMLLLAAVAAYGSLRITRFIVRGLRQLQREEPALLAQIGDLDRVLESILGIAFTTASVPVLLGSVSFALASLYLATDLDLLVVTPVPMRAVFLARFVEGLLPVYLLLFVLLLPALLGYGLALDYRLSYYLALPGALVLLPLLPMSLGVLLTMAVVRVIPPRRLRTLMAILGGLLGLMVYVGTELLGRVDGDEAMVRTAGQLLQIDNTLVPPIWGARALAAVGMGDGLGFLRYGVPFLVVTLGPFALAVALAERLFYQGWIRAAGSGGGRARRQERLDAGRQPWLTGPIVTILRKDLRMLPRDPQRLSQLLLPLALSVFWAWQLVAGRGGRDRGLGVLFGLTSITLLVCVMLAANLGLTGVSREGRGYWLLHLAPIGPWPVLWAKWIVAFLPFPIIGTLLAVLVGTLSEPPLTELLRAWALVVLTGVGVSSITTGFGAAYPRFDWLQAQRMITVRAGCLAPLTYYAYTGLMLTLTIGSSMLGDRWARTAAVAGWSAAAVLTAAALIIPLRLAAGRLRRLEL